MAKAYRKRVLGRGLSAILSDDENNRFNNYDSSISFNEISVDSIDLNPFQPRTNFNKKDIDNLASSIKVLGLIQPITVKVDNDRYELISGERRLRAFKLLKINNIPAYVRKADDQASLEMALVENIQRKDLDPIEIAISYSRLIDELDISNLETIIKAKYLSVNEAQKELGSPDKIKETFTDFQKYLYQKNS